MSHAHAPARRPLILILAILVLALLVPGWAPAKQAAGLHGNVAAKQVAGQHDNGKGKVVGVMTRNLYLGADLAPAIEPAARQQLVAANGEILEEVIANDFPTRAEGLADEILQTKPDLVGLQEVALWRTTPITPAGQSADARLPASSCSPSSTRAKAKTAKVSPSTASSWSRKSSTSKLRPTTTGSRVTARAANSRTPRCWVTSRCAT